MENTTEAKASLRNFRGSPRKARLILDLIRGKKVPVAKNILQFSTKRMAKEIHKLLNSAIANATNQATAKINVDDLIVNRAWADGGQMMKRHMPRANGRATMILKRTCHINITLATANKEE